MHCFFFFFNLQDDEKFCIFVTKDKSEAIILTMILHRVFTGFDSKTGLEFRILD